MGGDEGQHRPARRSLLQEGAMIRHARTCRTAVQSHWPKAQAQFRLEQAAFCGTRRTTSKVRHARSDGIVEAIQTIQAWDLIWNSGGSFGLVVL
jgi:hypothetical protein